MQNARSSKPPLITIRLRTGERSELTSEMEALSLPTRGRYWGHSPRLSTPYKAGSQVHLEMNNIAELNELGSLGDWRRGAGWVRMGEEC